MIASESVDSGEDTWTRERLARLVLAVTGSAQQASSLLDDTGSDGKGLGTLQQLIERLAGIGPRSSLIEGKDCLGGIFEHLHRLPVRDRALLVLWSLERLPPDQLAEATDRPASLVEGQAAEIAAGLYEAAVAAAGGCPILIAEDERITALELKETLEDMGHEVPWVAASAGQAISMASLHRPMLAVCDIRLKGGTDGISAAREIQETLGIPVILTTAYTDQVTRAASIEPYAFLSKPWSEEDLLRTLQATLLRVAIERMTPGLEQAISSPAPTEG